MESLPNPGARWHGGAPRHPRGSSTRKTLRSARIHPCTLPVTQPAQAALAVVSRFANHALSQQIEQAYAAAERARDYAKAAAAIAANECPPGTARDTLIAALAEHEANSERMMRAVLDFGRDHGHLAFAFRYAPDSPSSHGHGAQPRAPRPAADRRRTPARQRPNSGEARR